MKHACIRCLYPNAEQMTTLDCHLRDHDYPRHDPYPDHPIGTCRKAILMQNPRMMQGNYSAPQDDHCAPQAGWCYAVTMMCLTQPPGCTRLPATSRFEPSSADTGTHLTHHRDATWDESVRRDVLLNDADNTECVKGPEIHRGHDMRQEYSNVGSRVITINTAKLQEITHKKLTQTDADGAHQPSQHIKSSIAEYARALGGGVTIANEPGQAAGAIQNSAGHAQCHAVATVGRPPNLDGHDVPE